MPAGSNSMPPPPGMQSPPDDDAAAAQGGSPTSPPSPSPAPPQSSPEMSQGTRLAITIVSQLRTIAQAFPSTAPEITQINDLMRKVTMKMMQNAQPGEPMAPPTGA